MSPMKTKKQEQEQKQEPGSRQKSQTIERLGNGIFTPNVLKSWTATSKLLLSLGWEQREVDYVYHTAICTIGHPEHLNESKAARKFFPKFTGGCAKGRVANKTKEFFTLLFSGKHTDRYRKAWIDSKAKSEKGPDKRIRKTLEEKAQIVAEKDLKASFREENELGVVGKLSSKYKPELEEYLKKHMKNATTQILDEMKE